jgi:hypothetical protein
MLIGGGGLCAYLLYSCIEMMRLAATGLGSHGSLSRPEGFLAGASSVAIPILLGALFLWIAFQLVRPVFGGREVLVCAHHSLEITSIDFGCIWRRRNFAIRDVSGFRFGELGVSKYGAINGLRFEANGKRVKCLSGLRSVEAQTIPGEVERLGVSVTVDPTMPMMVEMERLRRKSFLGLF